ncbi:putative ABC transport system permease protein [Paenibacillus endophyticus]|uniref:Putative ABC transport system permease protein n=1 Tax=Paenibacillus endophyticus TaxID=1294268 RepID=A0A7W5GDF2_9BACL|nr:ABC transporter permease [Paenibacillus endophyticus]MBB3155860.1 putative ABC transport system permease protein [Paenibacillus endophyticus]
MYFRIAWSSVRRSFKDYAIYFLTLSFAVCLFYSFNSLEAQQSVLQMNQSSADYLKKIAGVISIISVGVSFVLGGLIVYANGFLIKRRKKELGIFMTLGMGRNKISFILVLETFLIGCLALGIGLTLGIAVSQSFSTLIAGLFNAKMNVYEFVISYSAIAKTCLYFGLIFASVIVFNHVIVSKVKLIDLLNAAKKNEELKVKNAWASIIVFLISVILLGIAYKIAIITGLDPYNSIFILSLLLGIVGTMMLFLGLAGFFLLLLQRNRNFYFKNLNMFVLRQVHNKINTNFVSMTVISLMLFVTLLSLFVVINYKANVDKTAEGMAPFSGSMVTRWIEQGKEIPDIEEALNNADFRFEHKEKHEFFNVYTLGISIKEMMGQYLDENDKSDKLLLNGEIGVVRLSDYNRIRALVKEDAIDLDDQAAMIISNYGNFSSNFVKFMENLENVTVNGESLRISHTKPVKENIVNAPYWPYFFYIVVPDRVALELKVSFSALDIELHGGDIESFEERYTDLYKQFSDNDVEIDVYTKEKAVLVAYGISAFLTFLGLYIGLVFLMSSAVVLALQQLVEASDSVHRYRVLKKIGATDKMINQTIFKQTFIYFFVPFAVAVMHTIVGVRIMNDFFATHNRSVLGSSAGLLAVVIILIYGGYFYTTYSSYKSIVRNS